MTGTEKWDSGSQTSKHHLIREFIRRGARVLYVENISMRKIGSGGARDYRKAVNEICRFARGLRSPFPGLSVLNPLYLPFPNSKAAQRVNSILVPALVRFHSRRIGLRNPVYVYFMPTGLLMQGRLGEQLSVYYITDNYAAFAETEHEAVERLESAALRTADVVFATAKTLADDRRALRPDIHYSPHGVEAAHFAAAQDPGTAIPEEIARFPRPRIGFMGWLSDDKIDFSLLIELARRHREWSIVLLGREVSDLSCLVAEPNIHYLGPKPYAQLPGYLKAFDVALVPFLTNELTRDVNPLKMREYLAAGLPVVATAIPSIEPYRQQVRLVHTADEFDAAICEALKNPGDPARRQAAVANESWSARATAVLEILEQAIARKRTNARS